MFVVYNHMGRKVKGFSGFNMAREYAKLNGFTVDFKGSKVYPAAPDVQESMSAMGFVC